MTTKATDIFVRGVSAVGDPVLRLWIPRLRGGPNVAPGNGPCGLPTLNEIIDLRGRLHRKGGGVVSNGYERLKRSVSDRIRVHALEQRVAEVKEFPLLWVYNWRAVDRRFDLSNIAAGGRKVIEDALGPPRSGGIGLISGDGWRDVAGFVDIFEHVPDRPGTVVRAYRVEQP